MWRNQCVVGKGVSNAPHIQQPPSIWRSTHINSWTGFDYETCTHRWHECKVTNFTFMCWTALKQALVKLASTRFSRGWAPNCSRYNNTWLLVYCHQRPKRKSDEVENGWFCRSWSSYCWIRCHAIVWKNEYYQPKTFFDASAPRRNKKSISHLYQRWWLSI